MLVLKRPCGSPVTCVQNCINSVLPVSEQLHASGSNRAPWLSVSSIWHHRAFLIIYWVNLNYQHICCVCYFMHLFLPLMVFLLSVRRAHSTTRLFLDCGVLNKWGGEGAELRQCIKTWGGSCSTVNLGNPATEKQRHRDGALCNCHAGCSAPCLALGAAEEKAAETDTVKEQNRVHHNR